MCFVSVLLIFRRCQHWFCYNANDSVRIEIALLLKIFLDFLLVSSSCSWKVFRLDKFRSSPQRCYIKKRVLKNFTKFIGKQMCESLLFNKVADLRTTFLQNTIGRQLLFIFLSRYKYLFLSVFITFFITKTSPL